MKKYFIRRPRNVIEPEEILLDARRLELPLTERMEFAVPERAIQALFSIGIAAIAGLFGYSIYLGAVKHQVFIAEAESNRLRPVFQQAPRGIIYDRFGTVLAKNQEVFDISALSLALPRDESELREIARRLAVLLQVDAEEALARLNHVKNLAYAEPVELWTNISREKAVAFEKAQEDFEGIQLRGRYIRVYPHGAAFSHLLGHTGAITASELERLPHSFANDIVGRSGIEEMYDASLRGEKGREEIEINARLEIIDVRRAAAAKAGEDLRLSIDAELQKKLYATMQNHMRPRGYDSGAAVALNPQTGEILALVSLPSFDNNLFAQGISAAEHSALRRNPSRPFFNRAIQGTYSPGSTIKPLIAAAALEEGIVQPDTLIDTSRGRIIIPNPYHPARPAIFRDWQPHGWIDARRAIAWSSNIYFYVVGGGYGDKQGLGITRISEYLKRFGLGAATGIDFPEEASGLVPNPEWRQAARPQDPRWRLGDTYLTSIGQGDMLLTPLQLAIGYAAIANGGYLLQPHLNLNQSDRVSARRNLGISTETLNVVREGMRMTATVGTARMLNFLPFSTAGKTGTAEVTRDRIDALFAVYAPAENPSIQLVVIVERGGEGSAIAVPIANDLLTWYGENRLKE